MARKNRAGITGCQSTDELLKSRRQTEQKYINLSDNEDVVQFMHCVLR